MNPDVQVSVIIPVYNCEDYLRTCLDSVIHQSLQDIEIICVDDGSTDSSLSILEEYQSIDERIKIIRQSNGGAGKARNTGLAVATGKYLSFLDADDFFELDMLRIAFEAIENSTSDFVAFGSDVFYNDTQKFGKAQTIRYNDIAPYKPSYYRNVTCNVFQVFIGWAWDKLYRADFVKKNNLLFQEQRTTNDMRFVFSALVLSHDFTVLHDILAHHRRNSMTSLSNTREKSWHCFHDALISLRDNLYEYGIYDELEQDFINYALHSTLWNLNTLSGDARFLLYSKLQEEWLSEFGLLNKSVDYFYDAHDYSYLSYLTRYSAEQYFRRLDEKALK